MRLIRLAAGSCPGKSGHFTGFLDDREKALANKRKGSVRESRWF